MGHHACFRKCAPLLEWPPIRVRVSLHLKWVGLQPRDTLVPEKPGPWVCSLPSLCIFILVLAWWIFIFSVAEKESNRETTKPFFPRPNPPYLVSFCPVSRLVLPPCHTPGRTPHRGGAWPITIFPVRIRTAGPWESTGVEGCLSNRCRFYQLNFRPIRFL